MAGHHAFPIDLARRALPIIVVRLGAPTDVHIPTSDARPWVVECLSCWGAGDEPQFVGAFATEKVARRQGDRHVHDGRLGTGA